MKLYLNQLIFLGLTIGCASLFAEVSLPDHEKELSMSCSQSKMCCDPELDPVSGQPVKDGECCCEYKENCQCRWRELHRKQSPKNSECCKKNEESGRKSAAKRAMEGD